MVRLSGADTRVAKNGAGIHEQGRLQDFHAKSGTPGLVDPPRTNGEAKDGCRSD